MKYKKGEEYYSTQVIKDTRSWKPAELEKEYNRLAKEKNRRLDALKRNFPKSQQVKNYDKAPDFESLTKSGGRIDRNAIAREMNEAYKFTKNPTTTVTGFRKQLRDSTRRFNEMFREDEDSPTPRIFTQKNIFKLFDFLEDYRTKFKNQIMPASSQIVDAYVDAVKAGIDPNKLLKTIDSFEDMVSEVENFNAEKRNNPSADYVYRKGLSRK